MQDTGFTMLWAEPAAQLLIRTLIVKQVTAWSANLLVSRLLSRYHSYDRLTRRFALQARTNAGNR